VHDLVARAARGLAVVLLACAVLAWVCVPHRLAAEGFFIVEARRHSALRNDITNAHSFIRFWPHYSACTAALVFAQGCFIYTCAPCPILLLLLILLAADLLLLELLLQLHGL